MTAINIAAQIAAASAPLVPTGVVFNPTPVVDLTVASAPVDNAAILASAAADGIVVQGDSGNVQPAGTATETAGSTAAPSTEPAPVLTRSQQLQKTIESETAKRDAAQKRIDTATAQLASVDKLVNLVDGSEVTVQLGRAETSRQVKGIITGIKILPDGTRKFKVLVGTGFDAETEVVNEGQIVEVLV